MRNLLLASMAISAMLFLFACQGPSGPPGPQGIQGFPGDSSKFDFELYVTCQDILDNMSDEAVISILDLENEDVSDDDLQGMVKFTCLMLSSGIIQGLYSDFGW